MKKVHLGDDGKSTRDNCERDWKDSPFFEAVGEIDELISWISLLITYVPEFKNELERIQKTLFKVNSGFYQNKKVEIDDEIKFLKNKTNEYWDKCGPITKFIIPGGTREASICHITRTVCRRAERKLVRKIKSDIEAHKEKLIFLNRLSDYFYTLARYINKLKNVEDKFL